MVTSPNTSSSAAPAQQAADSIDEIRAAEQKLVAGRELEGVAERCAAARNNADLVHGIGVLGVCRHQRVADFVVSHAPFLFLDQPAALAAPGPQ